MVSSDPRFEFMVQRCCKYLKVKWTRDVWDEELTRYTDKQHLSPEEIRATFDRVHITAEYVQLFRETIRLRTEEQKYDF